MLPATALDRRHPVFQARIPSPTSTENLLLALVDFKWLMVAITGRRVDLARMRCDADYAMQCLQQGMNSDSDVLRQRSTALSLFFTKG